MEDGKERGNVPFVLLADIVLLAEVDEVGDGFGGEHVEAVDDVDLCESLLVALNDSGMQYGSDENFFSLA